MIAIIDYDAGNIMSVKKALDFLGEENMITRDKEILLSADKVILPGVGAFGDAMKRLEEYGLVDVIKEIVSKNTPFLGICLGLQLMFDESEESPGVKGLSLLPGKIVRFDGGKDLTVPQIGWNSISFPKETKLFKGIPEESYVYFVHSYYLKAENREDVAATSDYGIIYDCAVESGNLFATQFHPEKSSDIGLSILRNFVSL